MTPDRDPARIIAGGQPLLATAPGAGGHLAANLLAFTRLLRRSGLPLGPGEALSALAALAAIDIGDRRQVHAALRAVMVHAMVLVTSPTTTTRSAGCSNSSRSKPTITAAVCSAWLPPPAARLTSGARMSSWSKKSCDIFLSQC